jgi:hypothetical protein
LTRPPFLLEINPLKWTADTAIAIDGWLIEGSTATASLVVTVFAAEPGDSLPPDLTLTIGTTAEPKYKRVSSTVLLSEEVTINHDRVRPWKSDMSS